VFSNEVIETGVPEIDTDIRDHYPRTRISIISGSNIFSPDEIIYQSSDGTLANASAQALVHTFNPNTSIDVYRTQGTFGSGSVIGNTSGAQWVVNTVDDTATMNTAFEDIYDNARIEAGSDGILDFSETNPFGEA